VRIGAPDGTHDGAGSARVTGLVWPARLVDQLAQHGFGFIDDFVAPQFVAELREHCRSLEDSGSFRPARIGRGVAEQRRPDLRGDFIAWLGAPEHDAERRLIDRFDTLRGMLNRELMTGLADFEGHFARYPAGAAYARHLDRLAGSDVRAISTALYLNEDWREEDGGALRIYVNGRGEDIVPRGGRLVAFLSDRFEHEVLPSARERLSFTGWFRRRALESHG
jgi:SM-20-related protein